MEDIPNICVICQKDESCGHLVHVTRGIDTLKKAASSRNDSGLQKVLVDLDSCYVHSSCRKPYTDKRLFSEVSHGTHDSDRPLKNLRSGTSAFIWQTSCLFCEDEAIDTSKFLRISKKYKVCKVADNDFRNWALDKCDDDDRPFSSGVKLRLTSCSDVVGVCARYHKTCYNTFRHFGRKTTSDQTQSTGRPTDRSL